MSVQDVVSRVEQLQSLFRAAATPGGNGGIDFASQLISASAAPGLTATAATAATPAVAAGASLASVPTGTGASLAGVPFGDEITAAAQRHGVDPALLAGLVRAESNFNPAAVSSAGATGLTQLMPATAAGLGVSDARDPLQALEGGAKYLRAQLDAFGGDPTLALAAYNAGPGNVKKYGGVPPFAETQAYVGKVQAFAAAYRGTPSTIPALTA